MLAVATVVTAVIAEILVGSIETFAEKAHLSDFFVAAVIVAIVGNAAEHGGAVVVAYRGQGQARRGDRALVERAGRRLPDPGRRAPLVADRAARALFPPVELAARRRLGAHRRLLFVDRRSSHWHGVALIGVYVGASRLRSSSRATALDRARSDAERARDRLAREIDVLVGDREMRDGAEHSRAASSA